MTDKTLSKKESVFRKHLLTTLSCLLLILVAVVTTPPMQADRTFERPLPNLSGEKAREYLKQEGLYDSLNEALRQARYDARGIEKTSLLNARAAFVPANPALPMMNPPFTQQAYIKASNTDSFDQFGFSVAISGDTVVVGALTEDSNATGVNGDQNNNLATDSGAAYVFVRSGTSWSQQAYLKASNTDASDQFGRSVAISGNTIVVGANFEGSNATGVNGNQSDNSALRSGAAYVFVRSGTNWSQQAYLKASNTDAGDLFGSSVAISGDTIVVGASSEDSNATEVNGNQSDNSANFAGAAYVFVRSGTSWSQQAYLKASNTEGFDVFGRSVSISGDTTVVGAFGENSNATGINGNQSDDSANSAGAAYVFATTDVQECAITCPANIVTVATAPGQTGRVVTFPPPQTSGDCQNVTVSCVPESGSIFPVGTTTVTCTTSNNSDACSFTVTVFDVCLQDEANPSRVLLFNSFTGDYTFCCGNVSISGRGIVNKQGGTITLQHTAPDRRVMGKFSAATRSGNASWQQPGGHVVCAISDFDIRNNTCTCGQVQNGNQ